MLMVMVSPGFDAGFRSVFNSYTVGQYAAGCLCVLVLFVAVSAITIFLARWI